LKYTLGIGFRVSEDPTFSSMFSNSFSKVSTLLIFLILDIVPYTDTDSGSINTLDAIPYPSLKESFVLGIIGTILIKTRSISIVI